MNCLHCGQKIDERPFGETKVKIVQANGNEIRSNMDKAIIWDCSNCCSLFIEMFDIEPRSSDQPQEIPMP